MKTTLDFDFWRKYLVLVALIALITQMGFGHSKKRITTDHGSDWHQWRGPNRDGISPEIGIMKQWPEG